MTAVLIYYHLQYYWNVYEKVTIYSDGLSLSIKVFPLTTEKN